MMRAVADGLFEQGPDGPRLIGSRCCGCGMIYFPVAPGCRNPDCDIDKLERVLLPDRGTLLSYTVQRYQPPPLFKMDNWEPYAIGLVDLGAGVEVMGMLTDFALDAIAIGAPVQLIVEHLYDDPAEGPVCTYKFASVK